MASAGLESDQFGHLLLAAVALVLLSVAGVQVWLLRDAPRAVWPYSVWRAAALAQVIC
jgi:hypothetical protein